MSAAPKDRLKKDHAKTSPLANALRMLSVDAVQAANAGHPGMPMGMADVATVLFERFLRFDPLNPTWPDRDRFILSAGHGSMLLYSLLHLTGYQAITLEDIKNFRQLGSICAGHPEYDPNAGIEITTGPLGQGLASAVGMALAERMLHARVGDGLVDHRTFVIAGDGDLMEGISHEAASLAGHLGLGRLIVLFDDNRISIDGATNLTVSDDTQARMAAYGWDVQAIDGHDPVAIERAIASALHAQNRPSIICCRTTIGFGADQKAGTAAAHGAPLGEEEVAAARRNLDWPHPPFVIPQDIRDAWLAIGQRGQAAYQAWHKRYAAADPAHKAWLEGPGGGDDLVAGLGLEDLAQEIASQTMATRQASGKVLAHVNLPALVGGSADLTPSNNTRHADAVDVTRDDYAGDYVRFGVREHAMAAMASGLALHGAFIPFVGTFLTFSDYARPAIRLAALMQVRVIYVMTHDGIGLGEDGPTHQPIEHLESLRLIPGVRVFRPADAFETIQAWAMALAYQGPSILALSRQGLPPLPRHDGAGARRGAYLVRTPSGASGAKGAGSAGSALAPRRVTILATGSEVALALAAAETLEAEGIGVAVVSVLCREVFAEQEPAYRRAVLGEGPRAAIEAGRPEGWAGLVGEDGLLIGMNTFGASAPAKALYEHYGLTGPALAQRLRTWLGELRR
ncbi:MAG: transketolase [Pseudomonadota bacterium]